MNKTFIRTVPVWMLLLLLIVAIAASMLTGAYPMSAFHAAKVLFSGGDLKEIAVMTLIRPPRILVAMLAGCALGLSGAALQGVMRNPLVSPDLVGVSSGAAFGSVLAIMAGLSSFVMVGFALFGGILALACTFALAAIMQVRNGVGLILAGFFVGAFFLAGIGFCLYMDPTGSAPGISYWMMGTFRGADPLKAEILGAAVLLGGGVLMGLRWRINLLSLNDQDAAALGVNVSLVRWLVITIVALLVAAQVAVSGVVGWVGLIVPHIARMLVGADHRRLLPASAFIGGVFVLGLDDLTRSVIQGEIPVSVLAAFIGTPFICILFWKAKNKGWGEQ
ncbi:FecCD family ABC transporter permease [Buttiauxella noackiae]|uniref:FecCD family ABC transporter permease n=1 Tax=Buttiauxella noackiae TaxID=82992 RepID=UPI0005556A1D|nr:iron ABC transporter permease [Buttiauxella noackiae]